MLGLRIGTAPPPGLPLWLREPFAAPKPASFDPAKTGAGITLSNANRTATSNGAGRLGHTRTTLGVTTGKYVASFLIGSSGGTSLIGFVAASQPVAAQLGNGTATVGIGADGAIYANSFASIGHVGSGLVAGDTLWLAVDADTRQFWVRRNTAVWNSSSTANPATATGGIALPAGLTGAIHLACEPVTAAKSATLDPNPAGRPAGFAGWVETVPVDLLVIAGQSNASGLAVDRAALVYPPDPGVQVWNGSAFTDYHPHYAAGLDWGIFNSGWSAEMQYARKYRAANPGRRLHIVKYVARGTQLVSSGSNAVWDWSVNSPGELFSGAATEIGKALTALRNAGYAPRVRMVCWFQGEADAADSALASAYGGELTSLIAGMRTSWGFDASTRLTIARVQPSPAFSGPVRTAQAAAVSSANKVYLVDTDGLATGDGAHFTMASLITIGDRVWAAESAT
jgi:hypothetical protein